MKFILFFQMIILASYHVAFSQTTAAPTETNQETPIAESSAWKFWEVISEFNRKLTAKSFLKSTQYYARGPSFSSGQIIDLNLIKNLFERSGFRSRTAAQSLLDGDFAYYGEPQICSNLIQTSITSNTSCLVWKNMSQKTYLLLIEKQKQHQQKIVALDKNQNFDGEKQVITKLFSLDPLQSISTAELDPILVAQFLGQEPMMRSEKKISEIPIQCLNAVIAIEDNQFLDHRGVSVTGLGRAVLKNILTMRKAQGGSTITQQLVKNYFLSPEKKFSRKVKEIIMSIQLETQWTKDEILETYLNIIYMGQSGAFQVIGFGAASQVYFGKPLTDLNLSECALLAAIVNNPGMNNPWKKSEQALKRKNLVLSKMLELNLISLQEKTDAMTDPLPAAIPLLATETAPYFFDAVRNQARQLGLPIDGTTFYTSLDLAAQDQAQKALQNGIKTREKNKSANLSPLQGVIVGSNLETGMVTTFVGGQNFKQTQFNRALSSKRQIGSLIKPIVYLSALIHSGTDSQTQAKIEYDPMSIILDEPFTWEYDKKKWLPDNYDKKFRGPVPFYFALKESLNSPTAKIAQSVGLVKIIDLAHKIGLTSTIPETPSSSLGASAHSPLEVLQAYSTIGSMGKKPELTFILSAKDDLGNNLFEFRPKFETIYDQTTGAVLVGLMQETLKSGTAKASKTFGFDRIAAGKTGTTSNSNDVWFAGFTPNYVSVVWLGYDEGRATKLTGASGALPIWCDFMVGYNSNITPMDFQWPADVEDKEIEFPMVSEKVHLIVPRK